MSTDYSVDDLFITSRITKGTRFVRSVRAGITRTAACGVFVSAMVFSMLAFSPIPAHAGWFSTLFGFGETASAKNILQQENSQNVALLEAADPFGDSEMIDGTIVDSAAFLSDAGPMGTLADVEGGAPVSDQISVYVVRKGDSLAAIAKMFGVSANTVMWANDMKNSVVSEGQVLVILPISGVTYTTKSGDTLAAIAKKFKGNTKEIAAFNGLAIDEKLDSGVQVIIPDGQIQTPVQQKTAPKKKVFASGPKYEGYYVRPVAGGRRSQGLHGYNAVDIAIPVGSQVAASANGQVIIARMGGWNAGYGNYVVLRHSNGTQTLYGHLSQIVVSGGESVSRGDLIGYSGNTGKSTGPHLHFEIRGAVNPF